MITRRCNARRLLAPLLLAASLAASAAQASSLVYQPVNPAFGGSPLNGGWLQNEAALQNEHQRREQRQQQLHSAIERERTGSQQNSQSPGQIFARQLQSQLYSSLANQITRAIFGEHAQESGTFSFEGTTIDFRRIGNNVEVSINDGGSVTTVIVPAGL